MTLSEFREQVRDVQGLIDFCVENHLDTCVDILPYCDTMSAISEEAMEYLSQGYNWKELANYLVNINDGFSWYEHDRDEWFGYYGCDEDQMFETYVDRVIEDMDGRWDSDPEECVVDDMDDMPAEEEPISLNDLFSI